MTDIPETLAEQYAEDLFDSGSFGSMGEEVRAAFAAGYRWASGGADRQALASTMRAVASAMGLDPDDEDLEETLPEAFANYRQRYVLRITQ